MRWVFWLFLIGSLSLAPAWAFSAAATTTRPAADRMAALIRQLGDPRYSVRSNATKRLHDIGTAALPALKRAVNDNDPEVQLRAARLIRVLEIRHVPGRPMPHDHERTRKVTPSAQTGQRTIEVNDEGRTIHITDVNGNNIQMTVKGYQDGRPATQVYKADTAQDLKFDEPEAYVVYERWANDLGGFSGLVANNVVIQGNGIGNANVAVMPAAQPALVLQPNNDEVEGLSRRLEQQMQEAHLADVQKQQVRDAIDQIEENSGINYQRGADEINLQMTGYDNACDHLRKVLADLHLPDVGAALPPPRTARLGIVIGPDQLSDGLIVKYVNPDSRADRFGLQEDDVIRDVNGSHPNDAQDLRLLVTRFAKKLVMEITRDGREMTLREGEVRKSR